MSDDGADLGITAEDGMKAAMGADEEPATRTPVELQAEMEADQSNTYSGQANIVALALVRLFEKRPDLATWPAEAEGAFFVKATGERATPEFLRASEWDDMEFRKVDDRDLYAELKAARPDLSSTFEGLTGFMWGWAVNAAKYVVGEPPVPNPAIITIGSGA